MLSSRPGEPLTLRQGLKFMLECVPKHAHNQKQQLLNNETAEVTGMDFLCVCVQQGRKPQTDWKIIPSEIWEQQSLCFGFYIHLVGIWVYRNAQSPWFFRENIVFVFFFKSLLTYWHLLERQSDRERERHEYFLSSGSLSRCLQQPDQSQEPKTSSASSTLAVIIFCFPGYANWKLDQKQLDGTQTIIPGRNMGIPSRGLACCPVTPMGFQDVLFAFL